MAEGAGMNVALLGGAVALILSILLAPLARGMGWRLGILDRPNSLSIHAVPVPRTGGVAVFLGMAGGVLAASLLGAELAFGPLLAVVSCVGLVSLIGLADDAYGLAPRIKLVLSLGVALLAFVAGLQMGTFPVPLSLPLTLLILVGAAHAMNLLDGMNGLAAGVGAIAALFLGALAWVQGALGAALLAGCLAGACGGFLPYNARRASLFLGDSGSLVLGFTLAALAITLSAEPGALRWPLAAGLALGLPALDMALAVARRVSRRQGLFAGDREHIYDLVHRQGMGTGKVVLVMYGLALLFGLSGLAAAALPLWASLALAAGEAVAFAIAARRLTLRVLAREERR